MRAVSLIAIVVTTVFPVDRAAPVAPRRPAIVSPPAMPASDAMPDAMMAQHHRPFFAALRRHLMASDDAIGWACILAGGGLVFYMAAATLVAWIAGRL